MRRCLIPDCDAEAVTRGWCNLHYRRWQRNGDPTGGRTKNGALEEYFWSVVIPYRGADCLLWPFGLFSNGYGQIRKDGVASGVHRLVCESAHGNPPTPEHEAAHSCGNRRCCNPAHIRWATATENMADRDHHGTELFGERHGRAKLSNDDVIEIRRLSGHVKQSDLAAKFGVAQATISKIVRREKWRHL